MPNEKWHHSLQTPPLRAKRQSRYSGEVVVGRLSIYLLSLCTMRALELVLVIPESEGQTAVCEYHYCRHDATFTLNSLNIRMPLHRIFLA